MPVRDRKFYIAKHNGIVEEESKTQRKNTVEGEMINKFTDLSQQNALNL